MDEDSIKKNSNVYTRTFYSIYSRGFPITHTIERRNNGIRKEEETKKPMAKVIKFPIDENAIYKADLKFLQAHNVVEEFLWFCNHHKLYPMQVLRVYDGKRVTFQKDPRVKKLSQSMKFNPDSEK